MKYICPVCGYDGLYEQPWINDNPSDEICPCCGIQFGYTDAAGGDINTRKKIYREWRKKWINESMMWWSDSRKPPNDWNPEKQLANIGVILAEKYKKLKTNNNNH